MNAPLPLSPLADLPGTVAVGAAAQSAPVMLADLSCAPRFGVKGPGAADWLRAAGLVLPDVANSWALLPEGGRVLRLGMTEYLIEGHAPTVDCLQATARGPGVYPVLRQDAALGLAGPRVQEVFRQVCNVNLVDLGSSWTVVLSSMAGVGISVLAEQRPGGVLYRIWCDGTYGHYLWETLLDVAAELGGLAVSPESLP